MKEFKTKDFMGRGLFDVKIQNVDIDNPALTYKKNPNNIEFDNGEVLLVWQCCKH